MLDLLRKWFRKSRPAVRKPFKRRHAALHLESLESRWLLYAGPVVFLQNNAFVTMDVVDSSVLTNVPSIFNQAPSTLTTITTASGITTNTIPNISGTIGGNSHGLFSLFAHTDVGSSANVPFGANGTFNFTPSGFSLNGSSDGTHTVTFDLLDLEGQSITSSTYTFKLNTNAPGAPTISLSPGSDSGSSSTDGITDVTTPTVGGTAQINTTIEVFDGATSAGHATTAANGTWSFTFSTALSQGAHSITATATDVNNKTSPASTAATVTVDTTAPGAPTITLSNASNTGNTSDTVTSNNKPTVTGTAEAGASVQIFDGAASVGTVTATGGNWSFTFTTALTDGVHNLTAQATDLAGNVGPASAPLALTIDTTHTGIPAEPDLNLATASDTGTIGDFDTSIAAVTLTGTTEANATVTLFNATTTIAATPTAIATTTADASGAFSFNVTLAAGENFYQAQATDVSGQKKSSMAFRAILLSLSPTATGTNVQDISSSGGTFSSSNGNSSGTVDLTSIFSGPANAQAVVRFNYPTINGTASSYDMQLFNSQASGYVTNFLSYVNNASPAGSYNDSIVTRSVPGFILQGGGAQASDSGTITAVTQQAAVPDNPSLSNLRGTVSMARGGANSATDQWFVNTADNGVTSPTGNNLDNGSATSGIGGFTVFGQVTNGTVGGSAVSGMNVIDTIAALPQFDMSSFGNAGTASAGVGLSTVPMQNGYVANTTPTGNNFVRATSVTQVAEITYAAIVTDKGSFATLALAQAYVNSAVSFTGNTMHVSNAVPGTVTIQVQATDRAGQQVTSNAFTISVS